MIDSITPDYVLAKRINWATAEDIAPDVSLSELCYKLDHGGGIGIGGAFAIHSVAPLPHNWKDLLQKSSVSIQFDKTASEIAATIPFYSNLSDEKALKPITLPCYWGEKQTLAAARPQFLLNCAKSERHCLVGTSGLVSTLLTILQRPWCVLEVCCCSLTTITAFLEFALLAEQLDTENYTLPVILLSHEKRKRETVFDDNSFRGVFDRRGLRPSLTTIRETYAAIFAASTRAASLNVLWLRILCVSGLELDLAYSELCKAFHDSKETMIPYLFSVYIQALKILMDYVS